MSGTLRAFERGLQVIRSFGVRGPKMTLAEAAQATELSRSTVRRLLSTLEKEGYVRQIGGQFTLTPRVLGLGYEHLSSVGTPQLALPSLERLSEKVREASSLGVLDGAHVLYLVHVPADRIVEAAIRPGTRFSAYRTSLGRVLLAALDRKQVGTIWADSTQDDLAPQTVTSLADLHSHLEMIRSQGYAIVDQELELGIRSIAAPLADGTGSIVAAISLTTNTARTSRSELQHLILPELLAAAKEISYALSLLPSFANTAACLGLGTDDSL